LLVRQHDRDRFLTALFAPAERREALLALYAFNFEVAKTREVVQEALLGHIRLQWWREAIGEIYGGGPVRRHEVVDPLAETIRRFALSRDCFDRLIAARAADLDDAPPADLAALERYAEETSGGLVRLALEILDARDAASVEAGRHVGIAWALTGTIRALPAQARMRRRTLPADLVATYRLNERDFFELRSSPALAAIVARIAHAAREHLAAAHGSRGRISRRARPALLLATLAKAYLRRLAKAGYDPFAPRLTQPDPLASWRLGLAMITGPVSRP
jgi:phytoene synthase